MYGEKFFKHFEVKLYRSSSYSYNICNILAWNERKHPKSMAKEK